MRNTMESSLRWTSLGVVAMGVLASLASLASRADAQIKPYFLVVVDTSGSMAWCAPGQSDCSCHENDDCADPFLTNTCGFPRSRIGDAKCALQRIIDSTGDATFGLMQFKHSCTDTCSGGSSSCEAQLVVEIQSNTGNLMREWVDGACQGTCTNNFRHELYTGGGTPIGQSLVRANQYLRGLVPEGDPWEYPTNPDGFDLAPASPVASDSQLACRPVSVILLTDGAESCGGNAVTGATALNTGNVSASALAGKAFRTYVIGFGTSTSSGGSDNYDPAALNAIALAGGTDAPDPTDRFFAASNEAELSVALNQIIADAQPPVEICNGVDDDCDGLIDEGLPKYCNRATGHTAKDLCDDPGETNCDGVDDNCDGLIDNGFAGACSTCTSSDKEVCDGIDNDCDLIIDEGTSSGAPCGPSKGLCEPGALQCIAGEESCEGGVGPSKEVCDCEDNDCDGTVDEDDGNALCGANMRCAGCECVSFCDTTTEFTASCPVDLTPEFQANGECLCVSSTCDVQDCAKQTVKRGGIIACAPNSARVAACQCRADACAPRCDGVTCGNGEACDPRNGRCVEDNCRGLGCDAGKLCEPISGECQLNACDNAACDADEVCRDGKCEATCAGVECADGKQCERGKCTEDRCATVSCSGGKVCIPDTGKCAANACSGVACKSGQLCDIGSGECAADPCWNVDCPSDQVCARGECMFGGSYPVTITETGGKSQLVATGGGGCTCSVPGPSSAGLPRLTALSLLALLGLVLHRRRRATRVGPRRSLGLVLAYACLLALLGAGCRVEPFCVDCVEKTKSNATVADGSVVLPDGRVIPHDELDASGEGPDAQIDDGGPLDTDAGIPQCVKTGPEVCNGKDDDCDFQVDEDTSAKTNDCLQDGVCAHTKPVCVKGKFVCHYAASDYEADETLCDGKDNDCDGKVDETFAALGTPCQVGVGECRVNGSMECTAAGTSLRCLAASPKDPSAELCDQKDNDCDGLVDEPEDNAGKNPSFVDPANVGMELCDGLDNDCDGKIDEPKSDPGGGASFVQEDVVQVSGGLWVHRYEASRPDATSSSEGGLSTRACARANALPWTNLTYQQAVDACTAGGMELCEVTDWITACESGASCGYAYTPASGTCDETDGQDDAGDYLQDGSDACVGHDITAEPGDPDTDALAPTGSKPLCYADHANGDVFDLSGNAKEWTTDPAGGGSPAKNPLRGGSYNNAPAGLRCDFDFAVGGPTLRLPNIGFRCCSATDPN